MKNGFHNPDISAGPETYLAEIRNRVTRQFCTFYFVLSILAVPSAYIAVYRSTFGINLTALFFYTIPFLLVQFTTRYRLAAQILIVTAMGVVVINGIYTNYDISPATIVSCSIFAGR